MRVVLSALGLGDTWRNRLILPSSIVLATALFLAVHALMTKWFGVPPVLLQALVGLLWLIWLGWGFPRHRELQMKKWGGSAYRVAFIQDILWGISCSFSQMLTPLLAGFLLLRYFSFTTWRILAGSLVASASLVLIIVGIRALGIGATMFCNEYSLRPPTLITNSIYKALRHPLYLGGVLFSTGIGVIFGGVPMSLALVNVVILPLYCWIEDRRCLRVFGERYSEYKATVGGLLPRSRLIQSAPCTSGGAFGSTKPVGQVKCD